MTKITYPKGTYDEFEYNSRDLMDSKKLGSGKTTEGYGYWPNGNLDVYTDGDGFPYKYSYDGHDRLNWVEDPLGNKVKYGYDDNSNGTSVDGIGSDGKTHHQGFDFDPLNRLTDHIVTK